MAQSQIDIQVSATGAAATARELEAPTAAVQKLHAASHEAATGGLAALEKSSELVQERVREMAGEIGSAGQVIGAFGPAGLAAAAGLGILAEGLKELVGIGAKTQLEIVSLNAVLAATHEQSGKTGEGLVRMAELYSTTTLATKSQVLELEKVVSTFGGITGDNFNRLIGLALDLAAVMGTDVVSAGQKMGRLGEDFAHNSDSLKRAGIEFTQAIKDQVAALEDAGRHSEAVGLIFDQIQKKIGGTAVAQGDTLIGAWHGLVQSNEQVLETWAKFTTSGGVVVDLLKSMAEHARAAAEAMSPLGQAESALAAAQTTYAGMQTSRNSTSLISQGDIVGVLPHASDDDLNRAREAMKIAENRVSILTAERDIGEDLAKQAGEKAQADREAADAAEKRRQADEAARLEGEKLNQQRETFIKSLGVQLDADQRLVEAYKDGQETFQLTKNQLAVETELRKLAAGATDVQRQAVIDKTHADQDARQALTDLQDADAQAQEAQKRSAELLQKHVDEQAKLSEKAARDMAKGIADESQKASTAIVDSFFHGADSIKTYFIRTFQEIAAAAIIRPIIQPIIADAIGSLAGGGGALGGLSSAASLGSSAYTLGGGSAGVFGGLGAGVSGSINAFGANYLGLGAGANSVPLSGLGTANLTGATLTSYLGAAGIGAGVGGMLTSLYGAHNTTLGSIGGAGTGIALAAGQPEIAALIAVATLLGNLFGGKPSDKTGGYFTSALGDLPMTNVGNLPGTAKYDAGNDQAAKSASQGIIDFVKQLQTATGASFNFAGGPGFGIETGSRDGVRAKFGSDQWQSFASAQDLTAALVQWVVSGISGVPDDVMTALQHIDFAGDMQGGIAKLGIVEQFLSLQKKIADSAAPVSQIEATWTATHDQIKQLTDQVAALGISADQGAQLVAGFDASFRASYSKDMTATLNQVSGRGFLNDIQGAIAGHTGSVHDAGVLGVSTSTADQIYGAQLKNILGGLSADQLGAVAQIFANVPEVLAAVGVASSALTASSTAATAAATAAAEAITMQTAQSDALTLINKLYADRITQLNDEAKALQSTASAWSNVAGTLAQFNASLPIDSSVSPYGLGTQVSMAHGQLQDLFDKGMGGDSASAAQFAGVAKQFLTLDKQYNASSATYAADFAMVQDMTSRLQAFAGSQVSVAQQQLGVLQQILVAIGGAQGGLAGKSAGPTYNAAYSGAVMKSYGDALAGSGLSESAFLNSQAGAPFITARDDLIAHTMDAGALTADLTNARNQASQPGLAGVGGGYLTSVINQMTRLGLPIPQFANGGPVMSTGLAVVHQGEYVSSNDAMGALIGEVRNLRAELSQLKQVTIASADRRDGHLENIADATDRAAAAPTNAETRLATAARKRVVGAR